jgi:amino acid permease
MALEMRVAIEAANLEVQPPPRTPGTEADRSGLLHSRLPRRGATLTSSIINLSNTIMGSGLLTLPSAFASSGLLYGVGLAVAAAGLNVLALHCLASAAKFPSVPANAGMGALAAAALPSCGGVLVNSAVVVYSAGVCIGYLIVTADSLVELTGDTRRHLYTLFAAALVTPLTLLRSLDALRFTSAAAIVSLVAITAVVVLFSASASWDACAGFDAGTVTCAHPAHDALPDAEPLTCPGRIEPLGRPLLPALHALGKFVLAFNCQQNMLPILSEMHRPTPPRAFAVAALSIVAALTVYIVTETRASNRHYAPQRSSHTPLQPTPLHPPPIRQSRPPRADDARCGEARRWWRAAGT